MRLGLAGVLWTTAFAQPWSVVIIGVLIAGSGLIEVLVAKALSAAKVPMTG